MPTIHVYHCKGDQGAQPLHCHEEIEFIAVYQGRGSLQCGRSHHATGHGVLSIVCPQEPHAGTPLNHEFAVKGFNLSCAWFEENDLDWRTLWHKEARCEKAEEISMFLQAYEAVRENHSCLGQEEALLTLYHVVSGQPFQSRGFEKKQVEQAVMLLREKFTEDISLGDIAASVGLTVSYFCRAFKKTVGISPHAYQNCLRVARAKTLLEAGESAGEAAQRVGFYDQSHLILHFKRLLGVTPAAVTQKAISSYPFPLERE